MMLKLSLSEITIGMTMVVVMMMKLSLSEMTRGMIMVVGMMMMKLSLSV